MRSLCRAVLRMALLLGPVSFAAVTLAGCDTGNAYPVAIFRPESPQAATIHDLSLGLLAIAALAFAIVEVALFAAVIRFRNRSEESVVQTHGNLPLEASWTAATALVVLIVLAMTVKTMIDVTTIPEASAAGSLPMASAFPGDTIPVRVVGHQWWWTFEYPQSNVITANEAVVPVGKTVKLQVESDDVVHSVWVARLGPKIDAIPGHTNFTSFLATQPGVYQGQCAEFCGAQHARMGFRIIAVPLADFSNWIKQQQIPAAEPATPDARDGQTAFVGTCGGCHTVSGTDARGTLGPNLTHLATRQTIAADTVANNPENLATWIRDPQAVKPENKMPKLNLDEGTVARVVAYLEGLK